MASNEEAEPPHLSNNTLRMYYAMHESMCKAHLADENEHAESTAEILLQNVDLPLYIRARALMVLACSLQPDYLDKAKEAVRIVEVGIDHIKSQGREPGEVEIELLAACKKVLEDALKDSEEQAAEDDGVAAPPVSGEPQSQQEEEVQDNPRTASSAAPPGLSFKAMDNIEHSEAAGFGGGSPYKDPMKNKDTEDQDEASRASASKKDDGDEDVDMD